MKKRAGHLKAILGISTATIMALSGVASVAAEAKSTVISDDGRYFADYESFERTLQAASEINQEVAAEGEILLKNENSALPMIDKGRVTVFGSSSVNVIGAGNGGNFSSGTGGMTMAEALESQGFVVNERITNAYKALNNTERGNETQALELFKGNGYYEQTYSNHDDAAVIIISRDCAEGSDKVTNTGEKSAADAAEFDASASYAAGDVTVKEGVAYRFVREHSGEWNDADVEKTYSQMKHAHPAVVDGVAYKHELQFTDSEEQMIQYVESQGFEKIILVMNTANNFELADAQADGNIDSIIWMGRPGADGLKSFAKIMSGEVNPSGRTVDLFFSDFTKDPTWQNVLTNSQTGSNYTYTDEATRSAVEFDENTAYATGDFVKITVEDTPTYYQFVTDHAAGAFNETEVELINAMSANGVEYEEDIYLGYRYAETAANEPNFADFHYDTDVLYPFGYGLSYSNFAFNSMELFAVENGQQIPLGEVQDLEAKLASDEAEGEKNTAEIKQLVANVEVENTGNKAGKQVVEIYVNAPYVDAAASTQKAYSVLAGYGKTKILQPGEKETVSVTINVQDIASYDAAGILGVGKGYTLEAGNYNVMALSDSHAWNPDYVAAGKGFGTSVSFNLGSHIFLGLDDYTDNATQNLFSAENGMFYTVRTNDNATPEEALTGDWTMDTPAFNANSNDPMTLMVRGNFGETYPVSPTADALLISDDFVDMYNYWYDFVLDGVTDTATGEILVDPANYAAAEVTGEDGRYVEKTNEPWLASVNEVMNSERYATLTQAEASGNQKYSLSVMSGIDPLGQEPLTEADTTVADFLGKTGQQAWDLFLNELTWGQLVDVVTMQAASSETEPGGSYLDYGIAGNGSMSGIDSPLNLNSTYQFSDNPTLAATFNDELARRQGEVVGSIALSKGYNRWWGPTVNLHRSPFGGRAHEYFSSDPLLCGTMAAEECAGAQSRGLACAPKHAVLNEQETGRSGLMTWASEQAIRELYAKPLQMLLQEGEGLGAMGAMNRIGTLHNYGNYNFITGLLHDEWDMRGSYTTDMGGAHGTMNPELMIRAGLNDVNNGKSYFSVGEWDATLRDGKGSVKVAVGTENERESFAQYYLTRNAATWVLYMHANSAMNRNGYDTSVWGDNTLDEANQGGEYTASVTVPESINAANVLYSAEELPAGLALNPNTGEITGTPTVYGDFDINITALLDSWINLSSVQSVHINPAFTLEALVADEDADCEDNVIYALAEDEVLIDVLSDTISAVPLETNERFKAMGVNLVTGASLAFGVEGELPAGLELDSEYGSVEGVIEADPGTYEFTIVATHSVYDNCKQNEDGTIEAVSMGPVKGTMTVNEYKIPVTIVVE